MNKVLFAFILHEGGGDLIEFADIHIRPINQKLLTLMGINNDLGYKPQKAIVPARGLPKNTPKTLVALYCITNHYESTMKADPASWLTANELEKLLKKYEVQHKPLEAVIATLKALDGDRPGHAKLVFWAINRNDPQNLSTEENIQKFEDGFEAFLRPSRKN